MKIIDANLLDALSSDARSNERRRKNWNIHASHTEKAQRFLNAMEPETYVCPHLHSKPDAWENVVILRGSVAVLLFSENGTIISRTILSNSGPNYAFEVPPKTWHTVLSLEANTVIFEFKLGPYQPEHDKNFARWAPQEGDEKSKVFRDWYEIGEIGSQPPDFSASYKL